MDVLYFHQYFATRRRSTATRSYELARRLVERGHKVTIVSRDTRRLEAGRDGRPAGRLVAREQVDGIDVLFLNVPYANRYPTPLRLASFTAFTVAAGVAGALERKPDVVYASSTPLTIGIAGLATARLKRVPFVFEIRDLWPAVPVELGALRSRPAVRSAEWLERRLYRRAAKIVVLSEGAQEDLERRGIPSEKLSLIPNAADLDVFRPDAVDESFRARHGLDGKFLAVYAGAIGRANGLDQLVDAAEALRRRGDDRVAIVALGDGGERPRLEERARALALDNLRFLPPVPKEKLAGIVGAADVTLTIFAPYPILETNSPNKFFDSLAAGKPAVVNLAGWMRRLVEENDAGAWVPAGESEALAWALSALAGDRERVERMGRNARALAEREFSRDLMADRLARTLEEAVAG
ncbi:MAG: glycosyltransferase family 4 protein [Thermoleophilia bacterium]|nr:glycosyltransferase family 4 protein [Thermoleophilia bacterium]